MCGALNWRRRQNCVACGSTQNTKVVNVIAKCGGASKQNFQMWKKLKENEKLNKFTENISNLCGRKTSIGNA